MERSLIGSSLYWVAGILIVLLFLVVLFSKSCGKDKNGKEHSSSVNSESSGQNNATFYPNIGKKLATRTQPAQAYLDPLKSYTRIHGGIEASYILEKDPSIRYLANQDPENEQKNWWAMPAGNYLVYSTKDESIVFEWWQ